MQEKGGWWKSRGPSAGKARPRSRCRSQVEGQREGRRERAGGSFGEIARLPQRSKRDGSCMSGASLFHLSGSRARGSGRGGSATASGLARPLASERTGGARMDCDPRKQSSRAQHAAGYFSNARRFVTAPAAVVVVPRKRHSARSCRLPATANLLRALLHHGCKHRMAPTPAQRP